MSEEKKRKLMDQVRDKIRAKHYANSTEKTYVYWIVKYIMFHGKRHPAEMGKTEIEDYLSYLAQRKQLSASSQNQAFNAILFLYRELLHIDLDPNINAVRAKRYERIPVVLTVQELLGHKNVKTTMIYTHVMAKSKCDVRSPLDHLRYPNLYLNLRRDEGKD